MYEIWPVSGDGPNVSIKCVERRDKEALLLRELGPVVDHHRALTACTMEGENEGTLLAGGEVFRG